MTSQRSTDLLYAASAGFGNISAKCREFHPLGPLRCTLFGLRYFVFLCLTGCSLIVADDPTPSDESLCVDGVRNGVREGQEECDPSSSVDNGSACTETCRFNRCGDGFRRRYLESCDGEENCLDGCVLCDTNAGEILGDDGQCYIVRSGEVDWHRAHGSCLETDGQLAVLGTGISIPVTSDAWIGGWNRSGNLWRWTNGNVITETNFGAKDPDENCEECRVYQQPNGTWAADNTAVLLDQSICMRVDPLVPLLGAPSAVRDGSTNHYYALEWRALVASNNSTWDDAQTACKRRGANLASLSSASEISIAQSFDPLGVEIRIGLFYDSDEFRWVDGSDFDPALIQWEAPPAEPSSTPCVELTTLGQLRAIPCDAESGARFLCEWD